MTTIIVKEEGPNPLWKNSLSNSGWRPHYAMNISPYRASYHRRPNSQRTDCGMLAMPRLHRESMLLKFIPECLEQGLGAEATNKGVLCGLVILAEIAFDRA